MTPVLALDLATSTGWALRDSSGQVTSGVQTFDLRRGESAGMRFLRFRAWLREVMALAYSRDLGRAAREKGVVAFEQAHHRGGHATSLAVGLVTVVLEEAAAQGWETTSVHTATLKKHATGKGNADKLGMLYAAVTRWPSQWADVPLSVRIERGSEGDADRADALCVLAWALEQIGEAT